MSFVTTIGLMTRLSESGFSPRNNDDAKLTAINQFMIERQCYELIDLTDAIDRESVKVPGSRLLSAVGNYFPSSEFVKFMDTLEWEDPDYVVLILQPEEGETTIWRPTHV